MEIIDNAKPLEYNQFMLQSNYDPYDKTLEEFCQYVSSLELSVKFKTAATANSTNSSGTKKRKEKKRHPVTRMMTLSRSYTSVSTVKRW